MMASRKAVLDKNKSQLLDSVNASNKIYSNEEISILMDELSTKVATLENAVQDSQLKLLNSIDPTTLTKAGKYYITSIVNSPYGTSGYFEVETSSDPTWRRLTYKYNQGNAVFENVMVRGSWKGWKLISGEVVLWTGSIIPNDTAVSFANNLRPYGTLRFIINNGEYSIDTAYDRNTSWGSGTTGWTVVDDSRNELVGIGYYITGDKTISIRGVLRHYLLGTSLSYNSPGPLTKIIGRP